MKNALFVLDVETGGTKEDENPITQIAWDAIDAIDYKTLHSYSAFIKPYNNLTIQPDALSFSRVTMQEVLAGIDTNELMKTILATVKILNKSGKPQTKPVIVGHNIEFDKRFLEYLFIYKNKKLYDYFDSSSFDTLKLCKLKEGGSLKSDDNSRFTLTACCERFGIELHGAHGAPADVEATKQLMIKLINLLRNGESSSTTSSRSSAKNSERRKSRSEFFFEM